MYQERASPHRSMPAKANTHRALNGIFYAIPAAALLWAAIAALVYLLV